MKITAFTKICDLFRNKKKNPHDSGQILPPHKSSCLLWCKVFNCIKFKLEEFSKLGLPVQLYIKHASPSQIFQFYKMDKKYKIKKLHV